jgi:hypothetical protein
VADRDEFRRPSERDGADLEGGELGRLPPGRRTLTQTIGAPPGAGATPPPGKIALTHRLPSRSAMELPYRSEMESGFGQDFSGVEVSRTTRDDLGGAGGVAQGESVAFAGSPSRETVVHELAHVVQHRQGVTGGEALADNGTSVFDAYARAQAKLFAGYHNQHARFPRPLVLEVIGDRFNVTYEANGKNELVFKVQYAGPYQTGGAKVQDRTIRIATPRLPGNLWTPLDVSVVGVTETGALFDLSGTGTELAELTFRPAPHATDANARTHQLFTRTNDKAGESGHGVFEIDVLLPSKDRPAPAGIDPGELGREKTASAEITLGPDALTLVARRFGESKKVQLHVEGGNQQIGLGNLLIPVASQEGPVTLTILEQGVGFIAVDLDGDGQMDARLVHTAGTGDREPDGTQDHLHYLDAYDRDKVKVAHAFFKVRGGSWQVPDPIDNLKNPAPDSAVPPAHQAPAQGNLPTEGSRPIQLASGTDWELRIDGDGDRQKELLLRFHQADTGKPVDVTAIQVSSGDSSSFQIGADQSQSPGFLDPVLAQASDGVHGTQVRLFNSLGYRTNIDIGLPVEDKDGRSYSFEAYNLSGEYSHTARFKKETAPDGNALATDVKDNKPVAGIRSATVRFGELADPFLLTVEQAPSGLVFGIAGLNPDGSPGSTSGHALKKIDVRGLKVVGVTSTQVGVDLDGDEKADIVIHDAIGQEIGLLNTPSLMVARYHQMSLNGAAVTGGASGARFQLRGRIFQGTTGSGDIARDGAGAAGAVVGLNNQQQEGADIKQILGRFKAGVSAQILKAGERGFVSQAMVSSWKALSEELIQLDAFSQVPAADKSKVQKREAELRASAVAHASTLYTELEAATTNERKSSPSPIEGEKDTWSNPYTGASLEEHTGKHLGEGVYEASTFTQIAPGAASRLGEFITKGDLSHAATLWGQLQDGVERWAQTRLERELGAGDQTVKQGKYMSAMTGQLTKIEKNKNIQRVFATFTADEMHRGEKDFFDVLPLQLWAWQDDGGRWTVRDLTNPEKPFDCHGDPEYRRVDKAGDRPRWFPPHHVFEQLNDKKKFAKGIIRYQFPDSGHHGTVVCEAKKKWHEWVQDIGLAVAMVGLAMVTLGAGTVVAVYGSYVLAASAIAGAVAAGGELADAAEHGWLDGMTVLVNLLQIAGGVASAGSIVAGNLVRGARAAAAAVEAGKEGASLWTGRLAKLAAMADKAYVPFTATALGSDIATVVVMSVDIKNKLAEIDASGLPEDQARDAKVKLLAMFALTGGLTVLSIKGDLPDIRSHGKGGPTIVLDQINGIPVAHAGGVRVGGADINVSPRVGADGKAVVDPNMHATARWQNREVTVKGLNEEEMPFYRAWMEQPEKVKFKANGEPEIVMTRLDRPPPAGLEDKLKAMVKTSDVAVYDMAWARTAGVEDLRQANGGHLDIDPTSPIWPAERIKLKDKLSHSLGSERKAEEMLSRYEQFRTGATGSGNVLHANQAAKLSQVVPPGEIDELRRMFPECEVYVAGSPISAGGSAKIDSIDVVVVVPQGTSADLMGAIEQRASRTRLRPDPDYAKAHAAQGMTPDSTLGVNVRAVSSDQFFGLATAKVKGKPAIDLHRLDVPTDASGRAYTAAELESMHKAGYEFDPASGQFRLRAATSRANLVGTGKAALRGDNTVVGNALPSEAVGQEVLRKLSMGDAEAFRVVGIEPPAGFDPRVKEWGLGQRQDGTWVLVEGGADAVNWGRVPGVRSRGHVHPIEVDGKARLIEGPKGRKYITMDELRNGTAPPADVMTLCPSGSDLAMAHRDGRHMVAVPYVHLGNGMIGNPVPGGLDVPIEFDILRSSQIGVSDIGQTIWYKAYVKIKAGDHTLFEGPMWGSQVDLGNIKFSEVTFKEPTQKLKPVPADTPPGAWKVGGGSTPSATSTNADEIAKAQVQTVDERRKILGLDPKRGHIEHEALVGAEIESAHGWFKRDLTGDGEWISLTTGKSYDLVGFPAKAIPHVKVNEFTSSIKDHFLKSIDYIVVDIRGLKPQQQADIKAYIAAKHAGEGVYPSGRLLLLE